MHWWLLGAPYCHRPGLQNLVVLQLIRQKKSNISHIHTLSRFCLERWDYNSSSDFRTREEPNTQETQSPGEKRRSILFLRTLHVAEVSGTSPANAAETGKPRRRGPKGRQLAAARRAGSCCLPAREPTRTSTSSTDKTGRTKAAVAI